MDTGKITKFDDGYFWFFGADGIIAVISAVNSVEAFE